MGALFRIALGSTIQYHAVSSNGGMAYNSGIYSIQTILGVRRSYIMGGRSYLITRSEGRLCGTG